MIKELNYETLINHRSTEMGTRGVNVNIDKNNV